MNISKPPKGKTTSVAGGGAAATAQVPMDQTPGAIITARPPNWKAESVFGKTVERFVPATVIVGGNYNEKKSLYIRGDKFVCFTKMARSPGWTLVLCEKNQMEIPPEYKELIETKYKPKKNNQGEILGNIPSPEYFNSFYFDTRFGGKEKCCGGVKRQIATIIASAIENKTQYVANDGEVPHIYLNYADNTIKIGNSAAESYDGEPRQEHRQEQRQDRQERQATRPAQEPADNEHVKREIAMISAAVHATNKELENIQEAIGENATTTKSSFDKLQERIDTIDQVLQQILAVLLVLGKK